jgi:hypothetical protein
MSLCTPSMYTVGIYRIWKKLTDPFGWKILYTRPFQSHFDEGAFLLQYNWSLAMKSNLILMKCRMEVGVPSTP